MTTPSASIVQRPALKDPGAPSTTCGACGFRAVFVHGDICPGCGRRLANISIIGRTCHSNADDYEAPYYCISLSQQLVDRIVFLQDICQKTEVISSVSCYADPFGVAFFDQEEQETPPPDSVWMFESCEENITTPKAEECCRTSVDELHVTTNTFYFSSHPRNSHDVWETDLIQIVDLLERWEAK